MTAVSAGAQRRNRTLPFSSMRGPQDFGIGDGRVMGFLSFDWRVRTDRRGQLFRNNAAHFALPHRFHDPVGQDRQAVRLSFTEGDLPA
ncbi:hypothetical protein NN6n1_27130 [Shinella zoogloeoides]